MADPISMLAGGSLVGTGISSLFGAGAAESKGADEANMYQYKAYIAAQNAKIATQNATYDSSMGDVQGFNQDLKTRQQVGSATADAGASGFSIGSSPSIVAGLDSLHQMGRYNTLMINANAARKAQADRTQAWNFESEEQMDTASASNARRAGNIGAISSLIGGATSIAGSWAGFQNRGMFSSSPMQAPF